MDKFLSNLRGEGGAKKDENKKGSDQWRGGSSDMDALKKKNASTASKVSNSVKGVVPKKSGSSGKNNNVFEKANEALGKMDLFNNSKQNKNSRSGGARLGGALPGRAIPIILQEKGPLGIEVEKRRNSDKTAIISRIIPNSQAERAGLQRGDIVCHPGGQDEYPYTQFISMAKSGKRPLRFDVRRLEFGGGNKTNNGKKVTADSQLRKEAVIAAAEAREAKFKAKTAPKPKAVPKLSVENVQHQLHTNQVDSEETKRAIDAVKQAERDDAEKLGYNPYEARAMTGGQARTATVAMTTGTISAENAPTKISGSGGTDPPPGRVDAPVDPTSALLDPAFEHAFQTLVTSNADHSAVLKSTKIMRTLITNAITKGQQGDDETSAKFRRVRLSNPKIKEAITDVNGALELMMCVGFVLSENDDDGETYLVYPPGDTGPEWLKSGIARMEGYEKAK